ncbi:TorF family putative porin [Ferrimonas sp. YFM]|uniref:TorF family putative porin n=1 Tax=Ferrimonas sp. YFM TaxID=3028878 RepID=UPI0025744B0C|nr:TorF family putative porin [Ferrimonas sp. YFM]BDY05274.1 hypothetical protein F0521_23150 [Ferrimonas sp. YFM]
MNRMAYLCLPLGLFAATQANAELYGNFGVASDYLWRGTSLSDGAPAVSAGLDYLGESGFYVGGWASSVDFGDDTSYEVDLYGGYAGELSGLGFDLGYIYYAYPNAGFEGESYDADFGELYAKLNWKGLGLETAYTTNTDSGAEIYEDALYVALSAEYGLSETLVISASVGKTFWDVATEEDYIDYKITLTKTTQVGDVYWAVSDTDKSQDDPKFLVGWLYAFEL